MCVALHADTSTSAAGSTSTDRDRVSTASTAGATTAVKLSRSDRNFFEKAAKSGMKEVSVSKATLDRLMNPQAKAFAQMMVSDHSKANSELMELAAKKGVTLPAKDEAPKLMEKWSKKTDDLDEDYMEEMVDDHQEAVELFENASKSEDPDIAAFARKTLPTLQHHLTMAKDLKKALD